LPLDDGTIVLSAECNRRSSKSLETGTAKLNAHVLTERLSKRSLLPNKLRCLLDRWRADRCFSGKPCGSCRVICSLSHARLRGYPFYISRRDLCHSYISPRTLWVFPLFLQLTSSSILWSLNLRRFVHMRYKRSSLEETAPVELYWLYIFAFSIITQNWYCSSRMKMSLI